jgi:hypothetical protein
VSPNATDYETGAFTFSGNGDVTAPGGPDRPGDPGHAGAQLDLGL